MRCTELFFDGFEGKHGVCPTPVTPIHSPEESYFLSHTETASEPGDANHEADWRVCIDCFSLYFEPNNEQGCAGNENGPHRCFPDSGESMPPNHPLGDLQDKRAFDYRLQHDVSPEPSDHSIGWRRCGKCSVLYFEPEQDDSNCPVGGTYEAVANGPSYQISRSEPASGASLRGWARCPVLPGGAWDTRLQGSYSIWRTTLTVPGRAIGGSATSASGSSTETVAVFLRSLHRQSRPVSSEGKARRSRGTATD